MFLDFRTREHVALHPTASTVSCPPRKQVYTSGTHLSHFECFEFQLKRYHKQVVWKREMFVFRFFSMQSIRFHMNISRVFDILFWGGSKDQLQMITKRAIFTAERYLPAMKCLRFFCIFRPTIPQLCFEHSRTLPNPLMMNPAVEPRAPMQPKWRWGGFCYAKVPQTGIGWSSNNCLKNNSILIGR